MKTVIIVPRSGIATLKFNTVDSVDDIIFFSSKVWMILVW